MFTVLCLEREREGGLCCVLVCVWKSIKDERGIAEEMGLEKEVEKWDESTQPLWIGLDWIGFLFSQSNLKSQVSTNYNFFTFHSYFLDE